MDCQRERRDASDVPFAGRPHKPSGVYFGIIRAAFELHLCKPPATKPLFLNLRSLRFEHASKAVPFPYRLSFPKTSGDCHFTSIIM